MPADKKTSGYKPVDVNLNVSKLAEVIVDLWKYKFPANQPPGEGPGPQPAPEPAPGPFQPPLPPPSPPPLPPPPPPAPTFAVPNVDFKPALPLHIQGVDIVDPDNNTVAIHVSPDLSSIAVSIFSSEGDCPSPHHRRLPNCLSMKGQSKGSKLPRCGHA